jgi:hypothetical protein
LQGRREREPERRTGIRAEKTISRRNCREKRKD